MKKSRAQTRLEIEETTALYMDGASVASLAAKFGVTKQCISARLKKAGVVARTPTQNSPLYKKRLEMKAFYLSGASILETAEKFGCSRQSVSKWMERLGAVGVKREIRTAAADRRRHERRARRLAAKERKCQEIYGCSLDEYIEIAEPTLPGDSFNETNAGKYRLQKSNAKVRGIPWDFTFPQWWKVWVDSGKWNERGLTDGGFVMARKGDAGGYSAENVEIVTQSRNIADAHINHHKRGTPITASKVKKISAQEVRP